MLDKQNSVLDDLAAAIGYTATNALVDLFGGRTLSVPPRHAPGHFLEKLVGKAAFAILVREFGGSYIWIPDGRWRDVDRKSRRIAMMYVVGKKTSEIAEALNMSYQGVRKVYIELEEAGLIPVVGEAREIILEKTGSSVENA